jgi:ubiquinone/menaquinone biosynthesis C-methylase UbiE
LAVTPDRYSHGHHESVLRSHRWRTAENSAGFLLPHLRSSASLLDVGCGPGNISADLANRLDAGTVVGIDLSPEVVEAARRDFATAYANLTFEVGDVYDLAFDDGHFDVVYAHQVLQHLAAPVDALKEMRRVLSIGGLLAVRDADYGAFVWAPDDPLLVRWLDLYHDITQHNHAQADAGRYLATWVRAAGFRDLVVSSSTWTFHSEEERAWWGGLWADRIVQSDFARQGLEYELTDESELRAIADAFLRWSHDADGVFVLVHVEVLARA